VTEDCLLSLAKRNPTRRLLGLQDFKRIFPLRQEEGRLTSSTPQRPAFWISCLNCSGSDWTA